MTSAAARRAIPARLTRSHIIDTEQHQPDPNDIEPFYGPHQSGIGAPAQAYTHLGAFDLTTAKRDDVCRLLQRWTDAAGKLCAGRLFAGGSKYGETVGGLPDRLTITFGFGPNLFAKDGEDRFGLAARRPAALVELPVFAGDQIEPARSNGDLSIQACANDPRTACHALRHLALLAGDVAVLRWAQSGFTPVAPRHGRVFRNGNNHPSPSETPAMNAVVWVGDEGPRWMRGGSYVVMRRIRHAPDTWDRLALSIQARAEGRAKSEDVPGAGVLRRSYAYDDGPRFMPERETIAHESGHLFLAYQKDPRSGFIKMFERLAKFDMLQQFAIHTGSGVFACPPGVAPGQSIGAGLFA